MSCVRRRRATLVLRATSQSQTEQQIKACLQQLDTRAFGSGCYYPNFNVTATAPSSEVLSTDHKGTGSGKRKVVKANGRSSGNCVAHTAKVAVDLFKDSRLSKT